MVSRIYRFCNRTRLQSGDLSKRGFGLGHSFFGSCQLFHIALGSFLALLDLDSVSW